MSSQWWFQVIHDQTLRFRCPESAETLRVESVRPENDEMVRVTIENETVMILNITHFVGVDMIFNVLEHSVDSHSFCHTLSAIMRGKDFDFLYQPLMSSPSVKKYQYKCPYKFPEQVEILRHLHPDCQSAGDNELLDSKNREWRAAAQRAMQYKGSAGCCGGHFKEAIVVSTISRRCYFLIRSIIATRKTMFLKVTGFLFRGLCGCRDEGFMYSLLKKWDQGDISPNDVNEQLKHEKELARPETEVQKLRTINAQLESKVAALEEEVKILRVKLVEAREIKETNSKDPHNEQRSPCIYMFEADNEQEEREIHDIDTTGSDSNELRIDNMYMFDTHETSQPETKTKRAKYTVSYKPDSDSELDDSRCDPDWINDEDEVVSQSSESDISLNTAFVSVTEYDPMQVMEECNEKINDVSHAEVDAREMIQMELNASPEETQDKTDVCEDEGKEIEDKPEKVEGHFLSKNFKKIKQKFRQTKEKEVRPQRRRITFKKGQNVLGWFQNGGKNNWREWYKCKITDILANGDLHRVIFEDGAVRLLRKDQIKELF